MPSSPTTPGRWAPALAQWSRRSQGRGRGEREALLIGGVSSHDRASSATAPRLPDAVQRSTCLLSLLVDLISRFPYKERPHNFTSRIV